MAPTSHLPYPPGLLPSSGQLQVDSSPGNYVISSNSLPITGREYFPQVGNLSLSSQDNWCQGLRQDRNPSSPEFTTRVCQNSISNDMQRLFSESSNYIEYVYSLIREFFDRSQILALEESHRILDSMITRLAPFASQSTESHNFYELVKALRVTQSRIEEKLISFFKNLDERYRMLVTFTLPQLRDHSYINVVNRSVHLNQSVRNRSLSPNSSLAKNASIFYDHVKTSSPIKGESKVPQFSPPLEQNIKDDSILQGANHKVISSVSSVCTPVCPPVCTSVSTPVYTSVQTFQSVQTVQTVPVVSFALSIPSVSIVSSVSSVPVMSIVTSLPSIKSAKTEKTKIRSYAEVVSGVNSRHSSGIDSPRQNLSGQVNSPNMGQTGNLKSPNMGEQGNFQAPKMGDKKGISARYLANFNIFLKRKNDVQVEVEKLLLSSKNKQIQPSTLKLMATDLKSKLTSLKIDKWVEDDKLGHFDPIDLCNWEDRMVKDINSVLYQTEDLINVRKGLAQSGIKKRDPPKFNGSVLDYPLLKKTGL